MTSIPLVSGTSVTRSGSTDGWTGLSLPASSTPYSPGDKSEYARFQIQPSSPLPALPLNFSLAINQTYATATGTPILDDTIAIGGITGPITNVALNQVLNGARVYSIPSSGLSLATLNANGYYLYIGDSASIATSPTGSLALSGVGTYVVDGGAPTAWVNPPPFNKTGPGSGNSSLVNSGVLTVTVSGGSANVIFVNVTVDQTAGAGIALPGADVTTSCVNGYGGSDTDTGAPPQSSAVTTVRKVAIALSGGAGSTNVTATSSATNPNANDGLGAKVDVSAAVTSPDDSTITISSISLSYVLTGGISTFSGTVAPYDEDSNEMTTMYIDDVLTFTAQFTQYSTGAAFDATGSPAYRVYENTTATPILTGSMALLDGGNTDGFYSGQITLSAANGFEVGKCYFVRVAATVDAIAQAGIAVGGSFIVRATPATATDISGVPAAVWSYVLTPAAGRQTTAGGKLAQTYCYTFNRNDAQGTIQTAYLDDSTTVMLAGSFTPSDSGIVRGKMV